MTAYLRVGASVDLADCMKVFDQLEKKVRDLSPFFRDVLDPALTELFERQFATNGAALGTPWAKLSTTTIKLRTQRTTGTGGAKATTSRTGRARAGFAAIERDTLRLYAAYTKAGGPGSLRLIDAMRYERGVDGGVVPYAAAQATGISAEKARFFGRPLGHPIPARPVIPKEMPAPVLKAWEGQLAQWLGGS